MYRIIKICIHKNSVSNIASYSLDDSKKVISFDSFKVWGCKYFLGFFNFLDIGESDGWIRFRMSKMTQMEIYLHTIFIFFTLA